ncbi:outer membrane beta-barrel protein [Bradyrhizobium sp. LHD-71]|uniref:outer membrane protein n=1 Tax=Bradyrhizobium sp. LHD-71 TaxID=3072141 RepID=UPI00280F327F|nr:outer membrane beta-barrel protein [Bradyrhizobium sp. LHD-71]MDQ8730001.1 outer membrane beta-barrel protein [Bradyrhizobium sp. LHD-71]
MKAPPPPAPPPFTWSGCYIGGFAGAAVSADDPSFNDLGNANFRSYSGGFVAGRLENPHAWGVSHDTSFIGGGTLGCNWQTPGSPFVLGIEGEGGYLSHDGSAFDPLRAPNLVAVTPDVLGSAGIGDWYAMVTGRLGYAWDRTMIYVKGGAAFLEARSSVVDTCTATAIGCGNWLISTGATETITTWTVGGGIEWAFAPNWSLKGEYMFIGLDESLGSCGTATLASGAVVGGGPFCFNHSFDGIHTAKIGLNYRFNGFFWGR